MIPRKDMQHYKIQHGKWPGSILIVFLFILCFELVSYFLFEPVLELLRLI